MVPTGPVEERLQLRFGLMAKAETRARSPIGPPLVVGTNSSLGPPTFRRLPMTSSMLRTPSWVTTIRLTSRFSRQTHWDDDFGFWWNLIPFPTTGQTKKPIPQRPDAVARVPFVAVKTPRAPDGPTLVVHFYTKFR